jgi:hypothetical protein
MWFFLTALVAAYPCGQNVLCNSDHIAYRIYCWVDGEHSPDSCMETCLVSKQNDQGSMTIHCNAPTQKVNIYQSYCSPLYNVTWCKADVCVNQIGNLRELHSHPYVLDTYQCGLNCQENVIATIGSASNLHPSFLFLLFLFLSN